MNANFAARIRKPLRILLAVSILAASLCLMGGCLYVFYAGGHAFSREAVSAAFRRISLPVWICLGLGILSALTELLLPPAPEAQIPSRQLHMLLCRTGKRVDLSRCSEELRKEVLALRSDRKLYLCLGWTILLLSSIVFLVYGLNPDNYHPQHIDRSVIRALIWLLPCVLLPFAYALLIGRRNRSSMAKELDLLKSAPKEARITPTKPETHARRELYLRSALLVLSLVLLVCGIFAGGTSDVLTRAANICTECIGLG